MNNTENGEDYKILQTLIDNEIDIRMLIEYFERFNQNLSKFQKHLEGTSISFNTMATNEFPKFVNLLKIIEAKFPKDQKRFIKDDLDQNTKFELMLQNTERLMWLLELTRRNETE